ncbi:MAG: peptidoglycan editing factor PgeF, partial [Clostridia bacterium]|nr:peptidoglycan editing factor PgeF [Clostridia bacterium]
MTSNTLEIRETQGVRYITFPLFSKVSFLRHGFSTRLGGVSTGACATMNLSFSREENRENVLENYRRFCGVLGIDIHHLVLSRQTHTNHVIGVTEEHRGTGIFTPSFEDIDGLITDRPGVALVTQYADCTPLLFCDPERRVIASSHSGWRGTVQEMGRVTVEKMMRDYGCDPKNILAGIGPCIGSCCYEVDQTVYRAFEKLSYLDLSRCFTPKENEKYMLDLAETNRQILLNAGILQEHIDVSDLCTCCENRELFSHRATG